MSTTSNVIALPTPPKGAGKNSKDRWPQTVLDRGYVVVPAILLWGQAKLGLSPDELNVLLQITSHWWYADSQPWISKERLAARMGKHPRTIQTYLTALEEKGLIRRKKHFRPNKGQAANAYDLSGLVAKLKALAPEFEKATQLNKARRTKAEKPA